MRGLFVSICRWSLLRAVSLCLGLALSVTGWCDDKPRAEKPAEKPTADEQVKADKPASDKADPEKPSSKEDATEKPADDASKGAKGRPDEKGPRPLNPQGTVLLDVPGKRVLIKSKVVLREGVLELLCCLKQTKEHESILSVDTKAYVVHTALLALGTKAGAPAKFEPEFQPATGQVIKIFLNWVDDKGKSQRVPAQDFVRKVTRRFYVEKIDPRPADLVIPEKSELRYDGKHKELMWYGQMKPEEKQTLLALSTNKAYLKAIESFFKQSQNQAIDATWVFTGSGFFVDEDGKKFYQAEDGDLISVANFPSATMDVTMRSSNSNESLNFEAWTERIPPKDTEVTIELVPVFK